MVIKNEMQNIDRRPLTLLENMTDLTIVGYCAEEKLGDGYFESMKCRYVDRYPDIPGQVGWLTCVFRKGGGHPYPHQFNNWRPDTTHACFNCSEKG